MMDGPLRFWPSGATMDRSRSAESLQRLAKSQVAAITPWRRSLRLSLWAARLASRPTTVVTKRARSWPMIFCLAPDTKACFSQLSSG